jgi:outer membrane protein assembly factor BamB
MNMDASPHTPSPRLRLTPGIVLATVLALSWFVVPLLMPDWAIFGMFGAVGCGLLILLWWLFLSRAPWMDRLAIIALMVAAVGITSLFVHRSISNGMMGMMLPVYSVPVLGFGLVAGAAIARQRTGGARRAAIAAAIVVASGGFTLVRTGGISGDGKSDMHWRWTPTPEERLLARAEERVIAPADAAPAASAIGKASAPPNETTAAPTAGVPLTPAKGSTPSDETRAAEPTSSTGDGARAKPAATVTPADRSSTPTAGALRAEWPGFRGADRDGSVHGVRIDTDWTRQPPRELWRRAIGPGWSSFAVAGDLVYTQEQRGEDEVVSAYKLTTGEPVWRHGDPVRFWESNGGAGPRATPTLHNGRVYTMGATGIVNALDAARGSVIWSHNAATDTGKTVPEWGIASSPLVIGDVVIVAVAGQLAAYDAATGQPRWVGQAGGAGYSSPHFAQIGGVPQVLLLRGARTISVSPSDGSLLWEHSSGQPGGSIVQPALTADGNVLIASGDAMGGIGIRCLAIAHDSGGWKVEERWASRGLKPYFSDFVVHRGYAFGFDGSILASIDLIDGTRKWKGGRYGSGQLVLLPDQDLLLVVSEEGELALVSATPDRFNEVARMPAIDGKTWNHPVLVGDVLLVRNGEEMAAFRLPLVRN